MASDQLIENGGASLKMKATVLFVGAVIGMAVGYVTWNQLLSASQSIAIVSIGQSTANSSNNWIEEPLAVIERMKSPGFAMAVAQRSDSPELAKLLPAYQYGGAGSLQVRNLRDANLLELKVSSKDAELAKKAIIAVIDQLIAEHQKLLLPIKQSLQASLSELTGMIDDNVKSVSELTGIASKSIADTGNPQSALTLLSMRASVETGLGSLVKSVTDLRITLASIRDTRAVTDPTVTTPSQTSLYRIVIAGSIAGLALGFLFLMAVPNLFGALLPVRRRPDLA